MAEAEKRLLKKKKKTAHKKTGGQKKSASGTKKPVANRPTTKKEADTTGTPKRKGKRTASNAGNKTASIRRKATGSHTSGGGSGTITSETGSGIRNSKAMNRRVKIGLSVKFTFPVALIVALVIALLAISIAKNMTTSISDELIKSGVSQVSMLANYGKAMIIKSKDLEWPVDLGLMPKEEFDKLRNEYTPLGSFNQNLAPSKKAQKTLYAAQKGGLLTKFISYNNGSKNSPTQAMVAYIISVTNQDVYWDNGEDDPNKVKQYVIARSEPGSSIPPKKQGEILINPASWVPRYVNLVEYHLGKQNLKFDTPEMPCVVSGGTIKLNGQDHHILTFQTPIYNNGQKIGKAILGLRAGEIVSSVNALNTVLWVAGIIGVLLSVATCFIIGYIVTRPIQALISDMNIVAGGDLEHKTRAHSSDEIGLVAVEFNEMTKHLLVAAKREKEAARLESELEMACEIQMKLLPPRLPKIKGFDIHATYHPAKEVGGDYYDFFPIDKKHVGIIVADVSGKGIPGSMVMATTRTILRFVAGGNLSSADTLSRTNAMVAADIKRGMFVTAFYIVLNVLEKKILCSSAGHNPMVVHHADDSIDLINPNGIALGFDKGRIFSRTIKEQQIDLRTGDRVVMYTDGVVEAMNAQNEEYTDERFYEFVRKNSELNSEDFVKALLADLNRHKGKAEQHDDITVVTFRVL